MKSNKKVKYIFLGIITCCLLFSFIRPAFADSLNIFDDPDKEGERSKFYKNSKGKEIGYHNWQWKLIYLENDDPLYDYYAIKIIQLLNPSGNYEGLGQILEGTTKITLITSYQKIQEALPDRSAGSYSIGTGVSFSGSSASFSTTWSYSLTDVEIDPCTIMEYGGYTDWDFICTGDAIDDQIELYYTTLIKTREHMPLKVKISLYTYWLLYSWYYGGPFYKHYFFTEYINLELAGNPSGGGGGGHILQ